MYSVQVTHLSVLAALAAGAQWAHSIYADINLCCYYIIYIYIYIV